MDCAAFQSNDSVTFIGTLGTTLVTKLVQSIAHQSLMRLYKRSARLMGAMFSWTGKFAIKVRPEADSVFGQEVICYRVCGIGTGLLYLSTRLGFLHLTD